MNIVQFNDVSVKDKLLMLVAKYGYTTKDREKYATACNTTCNTINNYIYQLSKTGSICKYDVGCYAIAPKKLPECCFDLNSIPPLDAFHAIDVIIDISKHVDNMKTKCNDNQIVQIPASKLEYCNECIRFVESLHKELNQMQENGYAPTVAWQCDKLHLLTQIIARKKLSI